MNWYVLEEGAYEDRVPVAVYASLAEAKLAASAGPRGGRWHIVWTEGRDGEAWYGNFRDHDWRITQVPLFG